MSSVIYFRMHHGRQSEPINFEGTGMRLIDLKRIIIEKKNIGGGMDFDLKVMDENDNEKGGMNILKYLVVVNLSLFSQSINNYFIMLCRLISIHS